MNQLGLVHQGKRTAIQGEDCLLFNFKTHCFSIARKGEPLHFLKGSGRLDDKIYMGNITKIEQFEDVCRLLSITHGFLFSPESCAVNNSFAFKVIPMNCPDDKFLCKVWAGTFCLDKALPTKDQYEALQREGFLPKKIRVSDLFNGGRDEYVDWLHGEYNWDKHNDWRAISAKVEQSLCSDCLLT